jgi:hypothetical protein
MTHVAFSGKETASDVGVKKQGTDFSLAKWHCFSVNGRRGALERQVSFEFS